MSTFRWLRQSVLVISIASTVTILAGCGGNSQMGTTVGSGGGGGAGNVGGSAPVGGITTPAPQVGGTPQGGAQSGSTLGSSTPGRPTPTAGR